MKRSEINTLMREEREFLEKMNFLLPPFAYWTPQQWRGRGEECLDIIRRQLGWDITDFGSGDFPRIGLLLFSIRNGTLDDLKKDNGKIYAEKILIVQPGQLTPTHFHYQKMEDIINRGGGILHIQFWASTAAEGLGDEGLELSMNGVRRSLKAGDIVSLQPGESVCIPQRIYHRFWGDEQRGTVLVGEVSRVNDDHVDNRFHDPVGRFPEIDEDEEPLYLLYNSSKNYYPYSDRA